MARALWADMEGQDAEVFRDLLVDVLHDIAGPQREAAAALALDWYADRRPGADFTPKPTAPAGKGLIRIMIGDAIGPLFQAEPNRVLAQSNVEAALEDIVLGGFRDTIRENATADPEAQGWERTPSPGACDYCMSFAGEVYATEGQFESHTHCNCTNEPVFI